VQATWGLIAYCPVVTLVVNLPSVVMLNLRGVTLEDGGGKILPTQFAINAVMRLFKAVTDTHS